MRVFELARTLEIQSKELLSELRKMKISVTTASSSIDDVAVKQIMAHYEQIRKGESSKKDDVQAEILKVREEAQARQNQEKERVNNAMEAARMRIQNLRAKKKAEDTGDTGEDKKSAEEIARQKRETLRKQKAMQLIAKAKGLPIPVFDDPVEETPKPTKSASAAPAQKQQSAKPAANRSNQQRPAQPQGKRAKEQPADSKNRGGGRGQEQKDKDGALVLPDIQVMRMDKKESGRRRRPDDTANKGKPSGKGSPRGKKRKIKPTKIFTTNDIGNAKFDAIPKGGTGPVRGKKRKGSGGGGGGSARPTETKPQLPKSITLQGELTVSNFADKSGIDSSDIIKTIFMLGEIITINDILSPEHVELLAQEFELEIEIIPDTDENDIADVILKDDQSKMKPRPPIVTVMGHVDHGKTTLMDAFRESDLVSDEYGGITQAIGAYHVMTEHGEITFIDTPGHAAFTAMRARGAQVTDVVILVVAADDGVMPQTIEALNHAKSADVPIIVAVNKMDKPGANPERVRNELMGHEIIPEEYGGDALFVEVSAISKLNIDKLLEQLALQTEILELKADPDRTAEGTIIESHVDPARGSVATVLVQKGTLRTGDIFVAGNIFGRVRRMRDEHDRMIDKAGPSYPAELIGLSGCPDAGEQFLVVADEPTARKIAEKRMHRRRTQSLSAMKRVTLDGLVEQLETGEIKELQLIVKADTQGSVEAIKDSLSKIPQEKIKVNVVHGGVGAVSESDVTFAMATGAIIVGFHVRPESSAALQAQASGVEIRLYRVIYELLEDIEKALIGMLEPTYKEKFKGRAEVLKTFRISKVGNVAGCHVVEGEILKNAHGRLIRDSVVIYEGKISGLRRVKDEVNRVQSGIECGIQLEKFQDIKEGDEIECFELEELAQSLS